MHLRVIDWRGGVFYGAYRDCFGVCVYAVYLFICCAERLPARDTFENAVEDALPFTVYATIRRADDAEYIVRSVLERVKWLDLYGMCRIVCLNPTNDPEIDAIIRRLVQKYPFAEIGAFQTRKNVL